MISAIRLMPTNCQRPCVVWASFAMDIGYQPFTVLQRPRELIERLNEFSERLFKITAIHNIYSYSFETELDRLGPVARTLKTQSNHVLLGFALLAANIHRSKTH